MGGKFSSFFCQTAGSERHKERKSKATCTEDDDNDDGDGERVFGPLIGQVTIVE